MRRKLDLASPLPAIHRPRPPFTEYQARRTPSMDRPIGCRTEDHPQVGRRELLQVGGLSLVGMGLGDLLRLEAQAAGSASVQAGTAKSVVFIFQSGGPSQHETFDPKPDAPDDDSRRVRHRRRRGCPACSSASICRSWRRGPISSRSSARCTTSPGREFRNEHNSCTYLLHTGTTELPVGDTNASIVQPASGPHRAGRRSAR